MTEQYVERGRPWLAWIIILVIIAFIVWLFVAFWGNGAAGTGNVNGAANGVGPGAYGPGSPGTQAGNGAAPGSAVTNPDDIAGSSNKPTFVGRRVRFENARVQSAEGRGFWIGSGDEQLFVLPARNVPGPPPAVASSAGAPMPEQVRNGETLNIDGVVERVPAANDVENNWGLNARQAAKVKSQQVYVRANAVVPASNAGDGSARRAR